MFRCDRLSGDGFISVCMNVRPVTEIVQKWAFRNERVMKTSSCEKKKDVGQPPLEA